MATKAADPKALPPKNVSPLSLETVKVRYPHLFQEYVDLSDREKGILECLDSHDGPVNNDGLCTKITSVDFLETLYENGIPQHLSEEGYKFLMFLWKMLDACESGSIGGEACRMYSVLQAAVADIEKLDGHDHLLAWTMAATKHGLYQLLYCGGPSRNQYLFDVAGDAWKEVYKAKGMSEKTREFSQKWCQGFHEMLVGAKEEYGDYADYSFDYIEEKPKPKKRASRKRKTKD